MFTVNFQIFIYSFIEYIYFRKESTQNPEYSKDDGNCIWCQSGPAKIMQKTNKTKKNILNESLYVIEEPCDDNFYMLWRSEE